MAKRNQTSLPAGFEPLQRKSIDGWYLVKEGNVIQGIYRGNFNVPSQFSRQGKTVHKIEITEGGTTEVTVEDGRETLADKGDLVGVDEKGWLSALNDLKDGQEVYIRCTGRGEAKKGQSAPWTFELGAVPF